MTYKLLVEGWRKFIKENEEPNPAQLDNEYDSAHVVIKDQAGKVLVLKRSEEDQWMPGKWSLPGGGRNSEESLVEAAVREIKEETNLDILPQDLQFLEQISKKQNHAFFLAQKHIGLIKLDSENTEYTWVDPKLLVPHDCVPDLIDVLSSIGGPLQEKSKNIPKGFEKRPFSNKIKGGAADNAKPQDFEPKELRRGIEHEMEHTNDPQKAAEEAADHLIKYDNYYKELEKMEKKLKK